MKKRLPSRVLIQRLCFLKSKSVLRPQTFLSLVRKCHIITLVFVSATLSHAQNLKYELVDVAFYQLPLRPFGPSVQTFSASINQIDSDLEPEQIDSLQKTGLQIPGYVKVKTGGDVHIELLTNNLVITNREVKDSPLEYEGNGNKTVTHQYKYAITYAFPIKLRITSNGSVIEDRDLPSVFTTEYVPRDNTSLANLQNEFDTDHYFIPGLIQDRIDELKIELKDWLFNNYGKGLAYEVIQVGYVKDKKESYDDVNAASAILRDAFKHQSKEADYLSDDIKSKVRNAIATFEKALTEASEEKKARINPKIAGMIQYNIALCHYLLRDFSKAELHLNLVGNTANTTEVEVANLREKITDKRLRLAARERIPVEDKIKIQAVQTIAAPSDKLARDYVVGKPGDTLEIRIVMPSAYTMPYGDSVALQEKIIVMKGDKKVELYAGEIYGYSFKGVFRESLSWIKDTNTRPWTYEKKFCERIVTGAIPVFKCYNVEHSPYNASEKIVTTSLYFRKDDKLLTPGFLNFNKGAAKIVEDYPALAEKVRNGGYQRQDFVRIIEEYNSWVRQNLVANR
jgi:hypothetical protein